MTRRLNCEPLIPLLCLMPALLSVSPWWASAADQPADAAQRVLSILFVGNSHTSFHDLPGLVGRMIEWGRPDTRTHVEIIGVSHLDELANNEHAAKVLDSRKWDVVVLQAQKISMSGRYHYSQKEGIDFAKLARSKGARVLFFSEWGRKGIPGDGEAIEKIYREMADAADAEVAPIGRAWDLALAERPELALHESDGNHESALGAFLTACAFYRVITGEDPAAMGKYEYAEATPNDQEYLSKIASIFSTGKLKTSPVRDPRK